jgi:hypothetical protein
MQHFFKKIVKNSKKNLFFYFFLYFICICQKKAVPLYRKTKATSLTLKNKKHYELSGKDY